MRVVVAMSGGVDSSVAALEIKRKGYEPIGVTMKTWPKEACGGSGEKLCCSLEAVQLARSVAEDLDIPFYVMNFSKEFGKEVTEYFINEYMNGRTPNPCIYCNSRIKFGHLYKKALSIGAEKIATGHYARILKKDGDFFIQEAKDKKKDQTYFLYDISKDMLPFIEFPLGDFSKEEVRDIASKNGFMTADRDESQDICFATQDGDYRKYISSKVGLETFKSGKIVDIRGKVVGRHDGIANYTVGQRKGLGVAMGKPVYVIEIDPKKNIVIIGEKEYAMKNKIKVSKINWHKTVEAPIELDVRIRYASKKSKALIKPLNGNEAIIEFKEDQFAPTPGQAAVFYEEDIVAGGGWIEEVIE